MTLTMARAGSRIIEAVYYFFFLAAFFCPFDFDEVEPAIKKGAVARLVGIEGGVVSGVFNLESLGVEAPSRRPRHDKRYHEA
jgi:hypothetical protein